MKKYPYANIETGNVVTPSLDEYDKGQLVVSGTNQNTPIQKILFVNAPDNITLEFDNILTRTSCDLGFETYQSARIRVWVDDFYDMTHIAQLESSNASIVTIDNNLMLHGNSVGQALISLKNDYSVNQSVEVSNDELEPTLRSSLITSYNGTAASLNTFVTETDKAYMYVFSTYENGDIHPTRRQNYNVSIPENSLLTSTYLTDNRVQIGIKQDRVGLQTSCDVEMIEVGHKYCENVIKVRPFVEAEIPYPTSIQVGLSTDILSYGNRPELSNAINIPADVNGFVNSVTVTFSDGAVESEYEDDNRLTFESSDVNCVNVTSQNSINNDYFSTGYCSSPVNLTIRLTIGGIEASTIKTLYFVDSFVLDSSNSIEGSCGNAQNPHSGKLYKIGCSGPRYQTTTLTVTYTFGVGGTSTTSGTVNVDHEDVGVSLTNLAKYAGSFATVQPITHGFGSVTVTLMTSTTTINVESVNQVMNVTSFTTSVSPNTITTTSSTVSLTHIRMEVGTDSCTYSSLPPSLTWDSVAHINQNSNYATIYSLSGNTLSHNNFYRHWAKTEVEVSSCNIDSTVYRPTFFVNPDPDTDAIIGTRNSQVPIQVSTNGAASVKIHANFRHAFETVCSRSTLRVFDFKITFGWSATEPTFTNHFNAEGYGLSGYATQYVWNGYTNTIKINNQFNDHYAWPNTYYHFHTINLQNVPTDGTIQMEIEYACSGSSYALPMVTEWFTQDWETVQGPSPSPPAASSGRRLQSTYVYGDLNQNGQLDIADQERMLQYYLGELDMISFQNEPDTVKRWIDIDQNEQIEISDMTNFIDLRLGNIPFTVVTVPPGPSSFAGLILNVQTYESNNGGTPSSTILGKTLRYIQKYNT